MTGNTHVAVGIASALVITQPKTVSGCLCAITGGIIGGMLCDIDSPSKRESLDYRKDPYGWQIYVFVILTIGGLLALDYVAGDGAVNYVLSSFGTPILLGGIAFLAICVYGSHTIHRTFMHSILADVLLTITVFLFCRPLAVPFAIGFSSHLVIDFFNKKKVQYFWPVPVRIGLNKYPSDGKLNEAIGGIGTIASIYLFVYFFVRSFTNSLLFTRVHDFFLSPVSIMGFTTIPMLVPYLIIINIISFIMYTLDYYFYMHGLGFYKCSDEDAETMSEFIMTLLLAFDILGGMIGKLLSVFIIEKGKFFKAEAIANFNLYIIPLCILISWMVFLLKFFFPPAEDEIKMLANTEIANIRLSHIVLIYFSVVNIITMLLFPKMRRFAKVITPREKLCMILSFFGGASGGYLIMKTTGKHQHASMLSNTLPEMIVMHAIILTCIILVI